MAKRTTTSYLILGLLCARDWSAYEIAEQLGRGVTELWPRAGRQLYNAPKRLVEDGLVAARAEATGGRTRTIYSITPAGEEALRAWLAERAVTPSALEFEGMVRVLLDLARLQFPAILELVLRERAPGVSVAEIRARTAGKLAPSSSLSTSDSLVNALLIP